MDPAQLSDDALLALVSRGDEAALGALYDRFAGPAYRLALRILRDPALAEDAVQDAFLAAWRTAASFQPDRARASTWLLTLVHRRAVDIVRREQRRRADPIDASSDPAADDRTDDAAAVREERRRVQRALSLLAPDQRRALELAYYGGLSQAEIAERLGVPLGTVKTRMFTGLGKLRDALAGEVAPPR